MAILDAKLEFSDAQALASKTSGTATTATNLIDLGAAGKDGWGGSKTLDPGEDAKLRLNVRVAVILVGASAAVDVKLYKHSAATSGSSGTVIAEFQIPAQSAAGSKFSIGLPQGAYERYLHLYYVANGATLTSGTFDAWISMDHET